MITHVENLPNNYKLLKPTKANTIIPQSLSQKDFNKEIEYNFITA